MCVYIDLIATIMAVTLWFVDSAAALKCNGYGLKSLLAGHLEKGSVHCRGIQYVNVGGSIQFGRVQSGGANFYH